MYQIQIKWIEKLRQCGWVSEVCYGIHEAVAFLIDFGYCTEDDLPDLGPRPYRAGDTVETDSGYTGIVQSVAKDQSWVVVSIPNARRGKKIPTTNTRHKDKKNG